MAASLGLAGWIYAYADARPAAPADAAIVLGAAVWDDAPSPVFEERIRHAIALYRRGDVDALVFTGGVGAGDQLAEAEVARQYAIRRGVPASAIYCETASTITYENLQGAQAILEREGLTTALIVSDPLHMRRAVTIARDLGIDAAPSPTPTTRYRTWRSKGRFLAREVVFYTLYLVRRPFI
jgi:uncharacterized SAM-binding protein YcdF (DUF218 family)